MKKVLLCGKLFTAENDDVLEHMAVVVEDNKITAVCSQDDVNTDNAEVIDLNDKFVMPGLIDGHMHTTSNGETKEEPGYRTTADLTINALLNAQTDLMAGFTTIRDEGSENFEDVALKKAINTGRVDGPRMITSGKVITATGGHADSRFPLDVHPDISYGAFVCDSPDECRKAVRQIFKYGADQVKVMGTGGVMSLGDEPGAPEFTEEEFRAIFEISNTRGRLSSVHAHGAEGMKRAMRAGVTTIEHGMLMDDEAIQMMADTGTYLIPTIIAAKAIVDNGVESGIHPENVAKAARCIANHYTNLKKCLQAGVRIAFGTDAGTPGNYHGKQTREFQLMKEAGLPPVYILHSATSRNAEMIRMIDEIGTITPGKYADITAFAGDPLEDFETMNHVRFVMKDGKIYKNI